MRLTHRLAWITIAAAGAACFAQEANDAGGMGFARADAPIRLEGPRPFLQPEATKTQESGPDAKAADAGGAQAAPQRSADDIAKALANPIANLISVPLQFNTDFGSGSDGDGVRTTLNIQPVIPFDISDEWLGISRTILPVIYQNADASAFTSDDTFGLGDTVQSLFLSPKTNSKLTWGVGPVVYIPTATDDVLGADQWGLGPTAVALVADGKWTYGMLANHIWSIGETQDYDSFDVDRPRINATFLQPFASYNIGDGWSATINTETTYDWEAEEWTVPINLMGSKVVRIGDQTVSFSLGYRQYVAAPDGAPDWGLRLNITLVFPR
ncbi:MAG: hypothetical protein RBS39_07420 [Phycisphaerales bacterium]|jgi:hypothetical protein|nr:hypothetical protein [Phycisphaerales bacterium]